MTGTDGREYGYLDEDDTVEQNVKAAKNGNNVVTTIDIPCRVLWKNTFNSSMKNMPEKKEVE